MSELTSLLDRIGGAKRAMILVVGAAAAGLIFAIAQWAGTPTWVPAFPGVPLENVTQITDKLDQAGVKYKLERGGADIMVAEGDLAKARVALAKNGMPTTGRPGLELFDQPSWGMTDFTQRINYRRALEGELERVIGKMRGIDAANVHLVLHETDSFGAQDRPTEASVVLKLRGEADPDVVKGIAHLVASSVDGLTSDHVTIVNDAGRMLSEAVEATVAGLSSRELQTQREQEDYLRGKAEKIVSEMVGASNFRVQVSAAMTFDQLQRLTATVDPDKQVVASENKAVITPGAQGGAAQNNTATTYENTRSTESYVSAPGTVKRLTVAVLVADLPPATPKGKPTPRTATEIANIAMLVRSAVGADSARGDVVSVVSVPFAATVVAPIEAPKTDIVNVMQTAQRPLLGVIGLALIILVALLSLKSLKAVGNGPHGGGHLLALPRADGSMPQQAFAPSPLIPVVMPTNTMRDKVNSTIEQQPDVAARVVRAWLKEA
ncbi:MAG: flagellar basal-body MS-ring/collar protein FliF [Gemmatimonadaceae bacterium]